LLKLSVFNDQNHFSRLRLDDHDVFLVDEVPVVPKVRIPLDDNVRQRSQLDGIWQVHADRDPADAEPNASAEVYVAAIEYPVI
jgi:hypothetical protein